jgi:hypothetical protein
MSRNGNLTPKRLAQLVLLAACATTARSHADVTLVYRTVNAAGDEVSHPFGINGRFVRVDSDVQPDRYWVIDAGLLTRADVDVANPRSTCEKLPLRPARSDLSKKGPPGGGPGGWRAMNPPG